MIGSQHSLSGLSGAVAEFIRAMDSVRKSIGTDVGLSANELRAMARVAESDGLTPKALAESLELTTGAVTAISTRLVARGLLVRVEQTHDRRSLLLHLTDAGHAVMERTYRQFQEALAAAAIPLENADQASLIRSLTTMTGELRNRPGSG